MVYHKNCIVDDGKLQEMKNLEKTWRYPGKSFKPAKSPEKQ